MKKRNRGYSASQAVLGLCETLIAGGECLEDVALLRADSAQALLRGHGLPDPTTIAGFCAASAWATSAGSSARSTSCLRACILSSSGRR